MMKRFDKYYKKFVDLYREIVEFTFGVPALGILIFTFIVVFFLGTLSYLSKGFTSNLYWKIVLGCFIIGFIINEVWIIGNSRYSNKKSDKTLSNFILSNLLNLIFWALPISLILLYIGGGLGLIALVLFGIYMLFKYLILKFVSVATIISWVIIIGLIKMILWKYLIKNYKK